jgi:hypothetical protein
MNFSYGGAKAIEYLENGQASELIDAMWLSILTAAANQGCRHLVFPAIGLGAFLPPDWPEANKSKVAALYYQSLMQQLAKPELSGKFDSIHINPVFNFARKALAAAKQKATPALSAKVHDFSGDVKFLAVELAKRGIKCGLLNPSDSDVIWGKYDIGEYYKNPKGDYVGEEDLASTSTASLGSVGMCDVYTNPAKMSGTSALSERKFNKITALQLAHLNELLSEFKEVDIEERLTQFDPVTKEASGDLKCITLKFADLATLQRFKLSRQAKGDFAKLVLEYGDTKDSSKFYMHLNPKAV